MDIAFFSNDGARVHVFKKDFVLKLGTNYRGFI